MRQLAPFVLLALLLHFVLFFLVHLPGRNFINPAPHSLEVYLTASIPSVINKARVENGTSAIKQHEPDNSAPEIKPSAAPPVYQFAANPDRSRPEASLPAPLNLNSKQFVESARSIAREEAISTERNWQELENIKRDTAAVLLEKYLRQPHKETRRADGTLRITTDMGEICFQPVPYFAKDMPGLYGVPVTCH